MPRSEYQMVVKVNGQDATEVFEKDVDEELVQYGLASTGSLEQKVELLCKKYVETFNASLRPGEQPRTFVSCEVLQSEIEEPDEDETEDDLEDDLEDDSEEDTEEVEDDSDE